MSFFARLFGRRASKDNNDRHSSRRGGDPLAEIRPQLDVLRAAGFHLKGAPTSSFARLGGLPLVPEGFVWPRYKESPLAFICQIDLSEVPVIAGEPGLPTRGYLSVFYDQEQSTWGFDPADRGSWRVFYWDVPRDALFPAAAPIGLYEQALFPAKPLSIVPIRTYPGDSTPLIETLLSEAQFDAYFDLRDSVYVGEPSHHLLGYPDAIQGDHMEVECQLASQGVYVGDGRGYRDERLADIREGASDWRLLLQIDSDDDADFMWGDVGRLYFWIRRSDLARAHFDDVWMVLQCS